MTNCLKPSPLRNLIHFEKIDSTNHYLRQHCNSSTAEEFTTVTASFQTAGRGQRGNSWESEAGKNLLFSFIIRPTFIEARQQFLISQLISLAIKEELNLYTEEISIKWPNDIYWRTHKIAGILIEHDLTGSYIHRTLIGVGLNINQELFHSNAPNPVSLLQITGKEFDLTTLLVNIIERFKKGYLELSSHSVKEAITMRYHKALFRKKGLHSFTDKHGIFLAEIIGVSSEGYMLLRDEVGEERSYAFKEVKYNL